VDAGELVTYTLTFANAGGLAPGVTVTATTPANTTYVSAAPAPASAPAVGGVGAVTWTLGDIPSGGAGAVLLTVRVNAPLDTLTGCSFRCSITTALQCFANTDCPTGEGCLTNALCSEPGIPAPCCTGLGTGTCQTCSFDLTGY